MSSWAVSVLVLIVAEVLCVAVLIGLIAYTFMRYRRARAANMQPEQKRVSA